MNSFSEKFWPLYHLVFAAGQMPVEALITFLATPNIARVVVAEARTGDCLQILAGGRWCCGGSSGHGNDRHSRHDGGCDDSCRSTLSARVRMHRSLVVTLDDFRIRQGVYHPASDPHLRRWIR